MKTSVKMTSIRLDTKLADDAVRALGARNRSEAVHMALKEVVASSAFPVIASGGISCVEDLLAVRSLGPQITGAIVGKALYDGKLDYQTALAALSKE